jgi:hypothetical protein
MKLFKTSLIAFMMLFAAYECLACDVWVKGYYRKNGTYVQGHCRSKPDGKKWNNYGKAKSPTFSNSYNTYNRDSDGDGFADQFDMDDDNDGVFDDYDASPTNPNYY